MTTMHLPPHVRRAPLAERPTTYLPLVALLDQLHDVISRLADAQYTQKPVGVVESSVGSHVRHCLDHVHALLTAIETGAIDYDHRQRETDVERDRVAALAAIGTHRERLSALDGTDAAPGRPLAMSTLLSPDTAPVLVRTTLGREVAYVLSHTIHHNAMIGGMIRTLGGWLPERFGYAPSTLRYQDGTASCVR